MSMMASIFLDVQLPNPTTWFYFSAVLAVAMFFKFSRLLSMRNLDVLTLYLFMPGLLLLNEGELQRFLGYLWLMISCLYFLLRCLFDLVLVRRPSLGSNLDFAGLAWMAAALYVGLIAVAAREPARLAQSPQISSTGTDDVRKGMQKVIGPYAPPGVDDSRLRLWAERSLSLLCHLSVVVGMVLIGWRHFQDVQSGMAAATLYLVLPYTYLLLPDSALGVGRWDHAWPMALMVWSVFTYRRPMLAASFLGVASATAFFLVLTLPVWLSFYRHRGALRFFWSFLISAGLGLAVVGGVLLLNGELPTSLQSGWTTSDWQPWKRPDANTSGFWQAWPGAGTSHWHAAYRIPIFIGSISLVLLSAFWPTPKNLGHVIALSAAVLLSIQFWYADRGGVYVLWFLPLLLLMLFRPNLSGTRPPIPPANDWPARLGRYLGNFLFNWSSLTGQQTIPQKVQ